MRRRRKKRTQLSVSLFPFLAVLICTLGVLIVMLVMAVKSADDQANQAQSDEDAQKKAAIQELEDELELRRIQVRGMESVRPDTLERLGQSRANRSYLEDEIRKLNREFERIGKELMELDRQLPVADSPIEFSPDEAENTLAALKREIEQAQDELESRRKTAEEVDPATYVIVPHKGGGGTYRRPIYIECTRDAITLQPSGIRLDKQEFTPPLDPGNVLDSALLSNREYWQRYDLAGDEGSPYPLIVVRPDGAETFVLARRAMKSWDEEFGYELVESDKTLDFGKNDPLLNAELNEAIREARRRQRAKLAFIAATRKRASQFGGRDSRPGLTASGRSGGFVSSTGSDGYSGSADPRTGRSSDFESGSSNQFESQSNDGGNGAESQTAQGKSKASQGAGGELAIRNPNEDLSLAKQRGSNWALPSKTAGATGYVRPIRLYCGPDYLELKSANGDMKRIPLDSQTQAAIDPLVDQVWKLIDSWGISGANSFWKPQLRVTVLPGGQGRFDELNGLLHQSGLTVQELRR